MKNSLFRSKNCCSVCLGNFAENLGHFLFQHLVTLKVTSSVDRTGTRFFKKWIIVNFFAILSNNTNYNNERLAMTSVTRWLEYLHNIYPILGKKIAQKHKLFTKVGYLFFHTLNDPSKNCQRHFFFLPKLRNFAKSSLTCGDPISNTDIILFCDILIRWH